jgi:hypothetical protein
MIPRFRLIRERRCAVFARSLAMTFVTRLLMVSLESESCAPISLFALLAATSCAASVYAARSRDGTPRLADVKRARDARTRDTRKARAHFLSIAACRFARFCASLSM